MQDCAATDACRIFDVAMVFIWSAAHLAHDIYAPTVPSCASGLALRGTCLPSPQRQRGRAAAICGD